MSVYARQIGAACVLLMVPLFLSCDPEKRAKDLLADAGLTLLQPAREYIRPGGLVSESEKREFVYFDPPNGVESMRESDVAVKFEYDHDKTAPLDLALGLIAQMVRIPAGLQIDGAQPVKLKDIDVKAVRVSLEGLSESWKANSNLSEQGGPHTHLYVISEVYLVKSITLSSATGEPLRISPTLAKALANCAFAGSGTNGTPANSPENNSGNNEASTTRGQPKDASSLSICRPSDAELTLYADAPIPFAVRLSKVHRRQDGVLEIRFGSNERLPSALSESVLRGVRKNQ
jgi:hypothetical protein